MRIVNLFCAFIILATTPSVGPVLEPVEGIVACLPQAQEMPDIEEFTNSLLAELEKEPPLQYLGIFLCTAYDDCAECQEGFVGMTALGVAPQAARTIAVDPNIIPLGSHVLINGTEYVAEDVGGGVGGNHIDIFVGSHEETFYDIYNGYYDVYLIY